MPYLGVFVSLFFTAADDQNQPTLVHLLNTETLSDCLACLSANQLAWVSANDFNAKEGERCLVPDDEGALSFVLLGYDPNEPWYKVAQSVKQLPKGCYAFADEDLLSRDEWGTLFYMIAQAEYSYSCSRDEQEGVKRTWVIPESLDLSRLRHEAQSSALVRDLINTPPNQMQSTDLAEAAEALANEHGATFRCLTGDDLLDAGFEATYTVGLVGEQPPCLIDLTWGDPENPSIVLVGKGVCFDTGGLCLKTAKGMETMKKDMGGAAHALGLAHLIMSQGLPISLRVLIPAVENGIGKGAYRISDVIRYRDGTTVEVMNTDAEGRLILADGILEAVSNGNPDLLIDYSTLTGAARIAVGMDIAAYFTNDDNFIDPLQESANELEDPVWPLPLYRPYKRRLKSSVADLTNAVPDGYGGATIAALFLEHFVPRGCPWLHFDVSAWCASPYYGQQKGAAVLGLRAVYRFLERFVGK